MTRAPVAARMEWMAWLPRLLAAITFAVYALVAPPASGDPRFAAIAGTADPVAPVIAGAIAHVPIGAPDYRRQLASALGAAIAVLLVARLVAAAGKDDAATVAGAVAGGLTAAACAPLVAAGTLPGSAPWLAAAVAGVLLLGHRVALGGGAGDALPAALLLGLAVAIDARALPLLIPLVVLYALRLRRGARWPLAAPAMFALALAGGLAQSLVRAAATGGTPRGVAELTAQRMPIASPPSQWAPWLEAAGDALGPLGVATAAVGAVVLLAPRSRWLGIAVLTALAAAIAAELVTARPGGGAIAAIAAATLVGAGVARVARAVPFAAGQAAIGGVLALVIAGSAALTSAHRVWSDNSTAAGP